MSKIFSVVKQNFAVLITVLVVLGVFNIDYYYREHYKFDPLPYITPAEVLSLSFLSIGKFSVLSMLASGIGRLSIVMGFLMVLQQFTKSTTYSFNFSRNTWTIPDGLLETILICISVFFIFYFGFLGAESDGDSGFIAAAFIAAIYLVRLVYRIYKNNVQHQTLNLSITLIMLSALSMFFDILNSSNVEARRVKIVHGNFGTKIITEDSVYLSDLHSTYIGRTSQAAFIYNFNDSSVTVIPSNEIKSLIVRVR